MEMETETIAAAPPEELVAGFEALVARNPACKGVYLAVLDAAREERSVEELVAHVEGLPRQASFIQDPRNALAVLAARGVLEERVYVDGQRYEGTRAQFAADAAVAEDAEVAYRMQTTPAGLAALERLSAAGALARLLAAKPERADGLLCVLNSCAGEKGQFKAQIERELDEGGHLCRDARTGLPTVYPAYFLGALEEAGAIVWHDGAWHLSDQGAQFLAGVR